MSIVDSLIRASIRLAATSLSKWLIKDLSEHEIFLLVRGYERDANGKLSDRLVDKVTQQVSDPLVLGLQEWADSGGTKDIMQCVIGKIFDYDAGDRFVLLSTNQRTGEHDELSLGKIISRYVYRKLMGRPEPNTPDEED